MTVTDPSFGTNLIEEVRSHPCLFDIRDPKYRHSECRNQAWNSVIAHLNYPGIILFHSCIIQCISRVSNTIIKVTSIRSTSNGRRFVTATFERRGGYVCREITVCMTTVPGISTLPWHGLTRTWMNGHSKHLLSVFLLLFLAGFLSIAGF